MLCIVLCRKLASSKRPATAHRPGYILPGHPRYGDGAFSPFRKQQLSTHRNTVARTLDARSRIQMLHYHWELTISVLRSALKVDAVQTALAVANECAVTCSNIHGERFKIGRARRPGYAVITGIRKFQSCDILGWRERRASPETRVSCRTPKTGDRPAVLPWGKQDELAQEESTTLRLSTPSPPCAPKHQFLVQQMKAGDAQGLGTSVLSTRAMPSNTNVILSRRRASSITGGFYRRKPFDAPLASTFRLEVLICFRNVVNLPCRFICRTCAIRRFINTDGTSLGETLEDEWFRTFDYVGFLMDVRHC
jgi:hypothetical protein